MKWWGNSFSINKFQLEDVPIEKFNSDVKSKNQPLEVNKVLALLTYNVWFLLFISELNFSMGKVSSLIYSLLF